MVDIAPSIFISYAHEDRALADAFAKALEDEGARVWLDQGELLIGDSLIERISEAIAEFDFVAALVSEVSVQSNWCRKEISLAMIKQLQRGSRGVTVLPLRVGDVTMPPLLADVLWEQLDADDLPVGAAKVVRDARRHLGKQPALPTARSASAAPITATRRDWSTTGAVVDEDEPVRMVGVDTEDVGQPSTEGTRGGALYRVPILLNRVPATVWSGSFAEVWNHPPALTSMHRPGIASVHGDRIVLDGTTIDELERYHLKTLKLVIRQLNEALDAHRHRERERGAAETRAKAEHDRRVHEVAKRPDFNEY